ncbi:hypothetical protein LDENG_00112000, partial [Lucifuga dentata]
MKQLKILGACDDCHSSACLVSHSPAISACLVLSYSPAISACLVFSSSPPFISLIHFRFGRCHLFAPIRHGFKPQSHTHPLPDCSLPFPTRDIRVFICGLTFCYRLGLSWTILLVVFPGNHLCLLSPTPILVPATGFPICQFLCRRFVLPVVLPA